MVEKVFCKAIGRDKYKYGSLTEVKGKIEQIRKESLSQFSKGYKPLRAYYCMMCSGFHLTHFAKVDEKAEQLVRGIVFGDETSDAPYLQDIMKRKEEVKIAKELLYKEEGEIIIELINRNIQNIEDIERMLILIKKIKCICNLPVYIEEYVKYGKY